MSLLPHHGILLPATIAFVTYGIRFMVFAALGFFAADPSRNPRWGYNSIERPASFDIGQHVRRELRLSLLTLCTLTTVVAAVFGYGFLGASLLYFDISDYPLWWFWTSIMVMILLHDTFFYWLHRALHSRQLFELVHRRHHESVFTNAFTSYSFGLLEALAEALIVVVIIFVIPVHPAAFVIFQTISIAYNVYGHCGRDFFPESARAHWLWRWMNTSSLHAHHHRFGYGNYSFYFNFWDRMMGTLKTSEPVTPCKK